MISSVYHVLVLSVFLFILGMISLFLRRNLIFLLISLEIMTNSVAFLIVSLGNYWNQLDGQIMYILIITVTATEISLALSVLLKIYKLYKNLDIYQLHEINK